MSWTRTFSGKKFHLFDPKPEQVCLEDIAWHLANICRWSGACEFFSVAQHCVLISELVPAEFALDALLHDAHEAYLGDIIAPLKQHLCVTADQLSRYRLPLFEIEARVQETICEALGVPWPPSDKALAAIAQADMISRTTEQRDLFRGVLPGTVPADVVPAARKIVPHFPRGAKLMFCSRWRHLRGEAEKKL